MMDNVDPIDFPKNYSHDARYDHRKGECVQLLSHLKSTVNELLAPRCVDVWSIHGGLERLASLLHLIFSHQYKQVKTIEEESHHSGSLWPLLEEVFLTDRYNGRLLRSISKENHSNRSLLWLKASLQAFNLSSRLCLIIKNDKILTKYYRDDAFLCQPEFVAALLTCLTAIELNNSSLLAEVNPLKLSMRHDREDSKTSQCSSNVSSASQEGDQLKTMPDDSSLTPPPLSSLIQFDNSEFITSTQSLCCESPVETDVSTFVAKIHESEIPEPADAINHIELETIQLKSDIKTAAVTNQQSENCCNKMSENEEINESSNNVIIEAKKNKEHSETKQTDLDSSVIVEGRVQTAPLVSTYNRISLSHHTRSASDLGLVQMSKSRAEVPSDRLTESSREFEGKKTHQRHNSYIFKQPVEGQSLISFLMSHNFTSCTDLDRENAHFNFAETLLTVIEQVRWQQMMTGTNIGTPPLRSSSGDVTQRVRIRYKNKKEKSTSSQTVIESDVETSTSGSDTSHCEDDIDDSSLSEFGQTNILQDAKKTGLSLSLASLYSDADFKNCATEVPGKVEILQELKSNFSSLHRSADVIAINILKKFSDNILPKASDLVWPASESETSPKSCPLPTSSLLSNENEVDNLKQNQLRGSLEWAPPRHQIICSIHEKPKLANGLARQSYRCAGCGSKVEVGCAKRYIFCEYLGKFFCPCCHNRSKSVIPGRILLKWDFRLYPVSHFAYDFLSKNMDEPWFHVDDELYAKVALLVQIRQSRLQLYYLMPFIQVCRSNTRPLHVFEDSPSHWCSSLNNIDAFSINELLMVKGKQFLPLLQEKVDTCLVHVKQCILCQAKGFVCEVCKNADDVLFPFEIQRVVTCPGCKASFHKLCFEPKTCPKCLRIKTRMQSLGVISAYD